MFSLILTGTFMVKHCICFGYYSIESILNLDELSIELRAELVSRVCTFIYTLLQHPYDLFLDIVFYYQLDLLLQLIAFIESLEIIE